MDNITTIFLDEKGTIRSSWRIALFLGVYGLCAIFALSALFSFNEGPEASRTIGTITSSASLLIVALVVGSFCGKLLENLPLNAIGLPLSLKAAMNLVLGCLAGVITFSVAILISMMGGGLSFHKNIDHPYGLIYTIGVPLLVFGVAAAFEEAFFRGYIFQTLTRSGYAWLAIFITAVPFGVVHLGNPNAGVISTINTILAGVWFGLAYLKTRDLWFVWGLHWFWNWTQASVFGIEVSGLTDFSSTALLVEQDAGPHWLTGTTYGIEGGIACTIAILLSIAAISLVRTGSDSDWASTSASKNPVATAPGSD